MRFFHRYAFRRGAVSQPTHHGLFKFANDQLRHWEILLSLIAPVKRTRRYARAASQALATAGPSALRTPKRTLNELRLVVGKYWRFCLGSSETLLCKWLQHDDKRPIPARASRLNENIRAYPESLSKRPDMGRGEAALALEDAIGDRPVHADDLGQVIAGKAVFLKDVLEHG